MWFSFNILTAGFNDQLAPAVVGRIFGWDGQEVGLKRRCGYENNPGPLKSGVRDFLFEDPCGNPTVAVIRK